MPELPEVEITRRVLLPLIRGRIILGFWTDWPKGLKAASGQRIADSAKWMAADIRGRRILGVERRGKVLFFRLSGKPERVMAIHLRMSGSMEVVKAAGATEDSRWVHVRWQLSGSRELRFVDPRKFGLVWYGAPEDLQKDPYLGGLGVDANGPTQEAFVAALRGRGGMIKPLLLRQDVIAGIGNILADESLWHAGIHPKAGIADLDNAALGRLHGGLAKTIRTVLASGGTSMRNFRHPDGNAGRYQERRFVYGRAGQSCPRCRTILERIVVGSRGTTICPNCQRVR